jgi:phospholipase C
MRPMGWASLVGITLLCACGGTAAAAPPVSSPLASPVASLPTPLQAGPSAPSVPAFSHVVILVLENHSIDDLAGRPDAPALNDMMSRGTVITNYFGVAHPSEPNYLALIAGDTFGIADDDPHLVRAPNLVDELEATNHSWKGYFEGLSPSGPLADSRAGYADKHDPFVSFNGILGSPIRLQNLQSFVSLQHDLAAGTLPDFSLVVPNVCHDLHDCEPSQADAFLGQLVSQVQASPAWDRHSALAILFDEDDDQDAAGSCCGISPGGGQTGAIVLSPMARAGSTIQTPYNHYSLLRTIEDAWSLPRLGHTGDPGIQPMTDVFSS